MITPERKTQQKLRLEEVDENCKQAASVILQVLRPRTVISIPAVVHP